MPPDLVGVEKLLVKFSCPLAKISNNRYIKAARGSLSNGESRFFYSDFIEVKNFDLGAGIRGRL